MKFPPERHSLSVFLLKLGAKNVPASNVENRLPVKYVHNEYYCFWTQTNMQLTLCSFFEPFLCSVLFFVCLNNPRIIIWLNRNISLQYVPKTKPKKNTILQQQQQKRICSFVEIHCFWIQNEIERNTYNNIAFNS